MLDIPGSLIALAVFLAVSAEGLVLYLATPLKQTNPALYDKVSPYLIYLTLLIGVGAAFAFNLNFFASMEGPITGWPGVLLTGVSIGRGSNYLNQLAAMVNAIKKSQLVKSIVDAIRPS